MKNANDHDRVRQIVRELKGSEGVLTRQAAAREYRLMASRIGHLVVAGDLDTLFGEMDTSRIISPEIFAHLGPSTNETFR